MLNDFNVTQNKQAAIMLGLPEDFIEKDYYVTKAIQILTNVKDEYFSLIFQGRTSLSKGHQVIKRLSEDIDFRIILKSINKIISKEAKRKNLRRFRHKLIYALQQAGYKISPHAIHVYYEGRFMQINAEFEHSKTITYLRPHIAIDCFFGALALTPQEKDISTLTKLTLGDECQHIYFPVNCVALDETAAEKWVALTRRVAGSDIKPSQSDKHLVRHLYDLYQLKAKNLLTGEYCKIIANTIQKDRVQFKNHNTAYARDPVATSKFALNLLFKENKWKSHWDQFLEQMVYDSHKLSFLFKLMIN